MAVVTPYPDTNEWRWPWLLPTHIDTHCKRCTLVASESVNHYFWECPKVTGIWAWIQFMAQLISTQPKQAIQLTMGQAIIGEPLDAWVAVPSKWWASNRGATIWYIWIA